eukprot:TRINITY_DN36048_c0_g1_i1.p1 TRINITY_DN36048_c0_g1~~TRINITY_DN36048_c0_g1_i1.p1  ORF type:complete len:163 (+),score=23.24 TRINITY_DN36048_c0_g1_i1:27-515(+)
MPHCFGYRARTRDLFAKPFKRHGHNPLSRQLINYKVGDYVDIIGDGSVHKGMPHKFYHGKTGRIFNINKRAYGVIVNKTVGNRIIPKRINLRFEHLRKSRSRDCFVARVQANDKAKTEANKKGEKISTKRIPKPPRIGHTVDLKEAELEFIHPMPFRDIFQG